MPAAPVKTRITDMLGIEKPIIQAAMGWIARSQLSCAVSNAGGMGIIETSSGELDAIRGEIKKMKTLTAKPFGVNVAQAFVRDPNIVQFIIDEGIKFVTTSAGDPMKYTGMLKEAGLTVFHVVPSLAGALRAIEAGVDGLIVEGGEGVGRGAQHLALHVGRSCAADGEFGGAQIALALEDAQGVLDTGARAADGALQFILARRHLVDLPALADGLIDPGLHRCQVGVDDLRHATVESSQNSPMDQARQIKRMSIVGCS